MTEENKGTISGKVTDKTESMIQGRVTDKTEELKTTEGKTVEKTEKEEK